MQRYAHRKFLRELLPRQPATLNGARNIAQQNGETVLHFLYLLPEVEQRSFYLTTVGFGLRDTRLVRHTCSHHGSHGAYTFAPTGGCFFGNAVLLVEYQQGVVQIGHISYQRSVNGLFVLQALKVERFGTAFGIGQLTKNIDFPTCRGNAGIGPRAFGIVETADATLRSEHKRRQVRKFGRHQRGFRLLDTLPGGKQVGVALQGLLDKRL